MIEGKDQNGYLWIQDLRYDNFFYLKDFEHLVVSKVNDFAENLPQAHWEAIVFEDETCSTVLGRQAFNTEMEAKESLERFLEISLKNRKSILE